MKKRNFIFEYSKTITLIFTIVLAYIIFRNQKVQEIVSQLNSLSYIGTFIAGWLYSFGFSAPFSTGFFLTLKPENILFAGIIGGIGSMFSNLFIFKIVRFSFADEFIKLGHTRFIKKINKFFRRHIQKKIRKFFMYIVITILIASPLPNEWAIIMLAELTKIHDKIFAIISFILSTIGILALLFIGSII